MITAQQTQLTGRSLGVILDAVQRHTFGVTVTHITIAPSPATGAPWAATIHHTPSPTTAGWVRLLDLCRRIYYNEDHARDLVRACGITPQRGPGRGAPLYITTDDAQRIIADQCPGVRINLRDITIPTLDHPGATS